MTQPTTPSTLRVALIGMGKMGRAIDSLAMERNVEIVARIDRDETESGINVAQLNRAEVAIEFTEPTAAVRNVIALLEAGCPVVIGTTGWLNDLPKIESAVVANKTAALWAPNFSPGVALFLELMSEAGKLWSSASTFDALMVETHHVAKKDAPSGTAVALRAKLQESLDREVPITSLRVGSVPGTHEIIFDAPFEQVRLTHEARDRRVFAEGAILAARWLAAQSVPQVYTMKDVIRGSSNPVPTRAKS